MKTFLLFLVLVCQLTLLTQHALREKIILMKSISLSILVTFCCSFLSGQLRVNDQIQAMQAQGFRCVTYDFLPLESAELHERFNDLGIRKGMVLRLDQKTVESLFRESNDFIRVPIQLSVKTTIFLLLTKHEICTQDFQLYVASDRKHPVRYQPGLHYKGIIEGDPHSLAGLSIYRNQVMAFISGKHGNSEIKMIPGDKEFRHVIFNVEEQDLEFSLNCTGPNDGQEYTTEQLFQSPGSRDQNDCVRIYIEIDDELVSEKGGVLQATDYMMGILNQSFTVFSNEGINMVVSEMLAWDVPSPYSVTNISFMFNSFVNNTGFYNGDLALMINYTNFTGHSYGSLAGLCSPNPDMGKCVAAYDHTVDLLYVVGICHNFGHLLGSRHTHECIWNGNNTSIDACFYDGGNSPCPGPDPAYPPNGGTMMSYCSPGHGWFYNLAEGFGPQPGNIIRNTVNQAGNCIQPCGPLPLYCFSNGVYAASKFIKKVVLGSISNESGLNYGYGNYISLNTNLNAGTSYSISLTPGAASQTKYWRVWIDYNHDEDWNDAGEQVGQGSANGSGAVTINFTVPSNTPTVSTRMRVSMSYGTYPPVCGEFAEGEVEDYTVNIVANAATCTDGIQNQGETGIDCGGPCAPCPTCNDGIQNQGETGVDCGGPCQVCPGGVVTLLASYFENGWDSWIDGGSDANRVSGSNAYEGQYCIRLADNSGTQSAMTSPTFNLLNATSVNISFYYYPTSMEAGEDFWVQYNGDGNWNTIASFVSGNHFTNNAFYTANVTVPNFTPTSTGTFRIQCDANDKNDQVFIDQVIITKNTATSILGDGGKGSNVIEKRSYSIPDQEIIVYPNPAQNELLVDIQKLSPENLTIRVIDLSGKRILDKRTDNSSVQSLDIQNITPGMYFLQIVQHDKSLFVSRFIKQ